MNCIANAFECAYLIVCESFQYGDPLEPVIYTICQSMPVAKIFLLGTYTANPKVLGTEYDLLVLIETEDKRPMHEYESLIENRCHDHAMITVSVFKNSFMERLLEEGNIFFSELCKRSNLVFNEQQNDLMFEKSNHQYITSSYLKKEFIGLLVKARSFLTGAINYKLAGDYQLAAFMLHQTIEHALNAFLTPLMGYRIQTHSLNKLFVYARRFSIRFYEIFPRDTDQEIRLYQTLHKAYISGRYKNNFQVTDETIEVLTQRAATLLDMAEFIFNQKLEELVSEKMILNSLEK